MASSNKDNNNEKLVLFSRDNPEDVEDIWDDTALIKAYDKSIKKLKKSIKNKTEQLDPNFIEKSEYLKKSSEAATTSQKAAAMSDSEYFEENEASESEDVGDLEWKVGDLCNAVYTDDGLIYPATIKKIFTDKKNKQKALIEYLDYLNEEEKHLDELYEYDELEEKEKNLKVLSDEETKTGLKEKQGSNWFFNNVISNMPMPPMIPHELVSKLSLNEKDKFKQKKKNQKEAEKDMEEAEDALHSMLMSWYMSGYHTGFYYGIQHAKHSKKKNN